MILTEEEIALTIAIEPDHLQIEPGKQATAAVLIRNRTEEVGRSWMRCDGPVEGWLEISPGQVSVFPLEEARAQITLHPPADAPGAKFSFIVRAVSQEHAGLEAKAVVQLDVIRPTEAVQAPSSVTRVVTAPRPLTASQIVVRAVPVEDSKLGPSMHQWRLSLRNAGAVLDTFGFNTSGIPARWVNLDPNEITLKPDEESDTLLTVRPIEGAAAGVYPFILRVYFI